MCAGVPLSPSQTPDGEISSVSLGGADGAVGGTSFVDTGRR